MKRLAYALALAASLLCSTVASAISPTDVMDGLRDKGIDALKDKAKQAGQDWIFDTGQSETMHAILDASLEATNANEDNDRVGCRASVKGAASKILYDIGYKWTVKTAGRLAFDTMVKVGSLATGGLGAAAEGGGLAWLAGQYADAAKGTATDAAMDAIRKAFGQSKAPEFELFETSGTSGKCDYTLRAMWDIAGGKYTVYIAGDCHCSLQGNGSVAPQSLGAWWITYQGSVTMKVAGTTVTWTPQRPKIDSDAQCACSKKPLRRPLPPPPTPVPGGTGTTPTGPVAGGGGTGVEPGVPVTPQPPPPPLPKRGRTVCQECQPLQGKIDAAWDERDQANRDMDDAANDLAGAQARLQSHQGQLADVTADPSAFDITPAAVQKKIDADNADIAAAKAKAAAARAKIASTEATLRELGAQLEKCIAKCGHSSTGKRIGDTLIHIGLDRALHHKHHDKDRDDEDEDDDRREEHVDHDDRNDRDRDDEPHH